MSQSSISVGKPGLRPVPMNVYPTLNSLQEVLDLADATLPIDSPNLMHSLLMTYHNSLLKAINDEKNQKS